MKARADSCCDAVAVNAAISVAGLDSSNSFLPGSSGSYVGNQTWNSSSPTC